MHISVTDAKGQLTDLVKRAEAGDEVILTRHGQPVVRLAPVKRAVSREDRRKVMEEVQAAASARVTPGPTAARSQDFLFDEWGIPG